MFDTHIIGQARIKRALQGFRRTGRLPHALLFHGPEGTGKSAAAVELARSLHCEKGEDGACDTCPSCGRTRILGHPDFRLLLPAGSKVKEEALRQQTEAAISDPYGYPRPEEAATIAVDRVRDGIKSFSFGSFEGGWRTLVLLDGHRTRPEASNALLKTLEEPPPRSLIILTAPTPGAVLPTILSRCQILSFQPVGVNDIRAHLSTRTSVSVSLADVAAEAAGGNVRRAVELMREDVLGVQTRSLRFLEALIEGRDFQTFVALEQLASDKSETFQVLKSAEIWLAEALRYRYRGEAVLQPGSARHDDVRRLADLFDDRLINTAASEFERIREMNRRNINLQVSLVAMWRRLKAAAQTTGAPVQALVT